MMPMGRVRKVSTIEGPACCCISCVPSLGEAYTPCLPRLGAAGAAKEAAPHRAPLPTAGIGVCRGGRLQAGVHATSGTGAAAAGTTQLLLLLGLLLLGLLQGSREGDWPSVETDDAGLRVP